ncbi:tRNA(adenine34) deaminase [Clostridium cavendishii DSM 21758]|uniref:tRNA-specific adenosine deaminase n=1 Tax=Clostridium cavendishii DSM 21758 TaxID=1121302 RepID=A0A1M6SVL2_9CLOT|nr:nucleoside deaminase [Clostridium cavendishii]SHK48716.1 tRNA(adenine34) deaminase [Clostridium cavendishii DSM 21758]
MKEALKEAYKAKDKGEVPVGAVIVKDNKIIARAHNLRESLNSPIAHAEILAIEEASKTLGSWRLNGCELFVTLEPCPMCAGAILQSRISRLYIGTFDESSGACGSVINLVQNRNLSYFLEVNWNYNEECSRVLSEFFKEKRRT